MSWLTRPRKGRIGEFSTWMMYNPKALQSAIKFIRWAQPILWGIMALAFILFRITVPAIIFTILFVSSAWTLFKYLKSYKAMSMNINEVKEIIFKTNKHPYVKSKIVAKVNKQYGRN